MGPHLISSTFNNQSFAFNFRHSACVHDYMESNSYMTVYDISLATIFPSIICQQNNIVDNKTL